MSDLSTRVEGGWSPPDTLPYDEDFLQRTLGSSPHVAPHHKGSNPDFFSISEQNKVVQTFTRKAGALKRVRTSDWVDSNSEQKLEPDHDSTILGPINKEPQGRS